MSDSTSGSSEPGQEPSKSSNQEGSRAVFQVLIEGSIDDVWRELTKTDEVQPSMFNSRMHVDRLEPGGQLRMRSPDGRFTAVSGQIIEVERQRRFAHTFRFTTYDDPECTVIYDLEETEKGVLFTLTVEDIPVGTKSAKQMMSGGTFITKTLKSMIETGRPPFTARLLFLLFKLLAPFNPAKARSENWPLSKS